MEETSQGIASVSQNSASGTDTHPDAIATLRAANRALEDHVEALEAVADHAAAMEVSMLRAKCTASPLHDLQPRGAMLSARELAWDMIRNLWMTGVVPPPSAFALWARMPIDDFVAVESAAGEVHRLSYAIYKATPNPNAELERFMHEAFSARLSVLAALRTAPEGYLSSCVGATIAAANEADILPAQTRLNAVMENLQITEAQRSGLSIAWNTFLETMATVSQDVALLEGVLAYGGHEVDDTMPGPPAQTKATNFLTAAMTAKALALCNERRLAALMALAWSAHEHLHWWQYMELYQAADKAPFDYIHVFSTLTGGPCGDGEGSGPALSAASATGDCTSCVSG